MLSINFLTPELEEEAINATALHYNYQEKVMNHDEGKPMDNPMSKKDFVVKVFADIMKSSLIKARKNAAIVEAAQKAELEGQEIQLI